MYKQFRAVLVPLLLTKYKLKLENYDNRKMYDKSWRILCAGSVAWRTRIVEILWLWTQLRGVLLHCARPLERVERHVERFEKHALNYSALSSRTINRITNSKLTIMKRNYYNCEMVKVDQNEFDEIMSKRVTMLSSLEEFILENIRIQVFLPLGYHSSCFCDGCLYIDINKSGHNDCVFLVRGKNGLLSYYVDEDNNMYMMRFLN